MDLATRTTPWGDWLRAKIAAAAAEHPDVPAVACQICFVNGTAVNGVVSETDTPGIFKILVEGMDQNKQHRILDRYFTADAVFFVDVPKELPLIQRAPLIVAPA